MTNSEIVSSVGKVDNIYQLLIMNQLYPFTKQLQKRLIYLKVCTAIVQEKRNENRFRETFEETGLDKTFKNWKKGAAKAAKIL